MVQLPLANTHGVQRSTYQGPMPTPESVISVIHRAERLSELGTSTIHTAGKGVTTLYCATCGIDASLFT